MGITKDIQKMRAVAQAARYEQFVQFMTEQFGRPLKTGDLIEGNTDWFDPICGKSPTTVMIVVSVGLERVAKNGAVSLMMSNCNDNRHTKQFFMSAGYALAFGKTRLKQARAKLIGYEPLLVKDKLHINDVIEVA